MTSLDIYAQDLPPGLLDSFSRIERRQTQDEGRRAADHVDGDGGGPTVDWTWKHIAGILSVLAFTFTLGANWHRLDAMTDRFDTHVKQNADDHATFAHKDVVESEFNNLKQQLDRIEKALERRRPL
jgi:hypothetical protein